jgi:hypothetical protein
MSVREKDYVGDPDWVELFDGPESLVMMVRARLTDAGIPSRLDQRIIANKGPAFAVAVNRPHLTEANDILCSVVNSQPSSRLFFSSPSPAMGTVTSTANTSPSRIATMTETTRLLCATALLAGSTYRKQMLAFLSRRSRAVAPELGIDVPLVAQVARSLEIRQFRFELLYLALAVLAILMFLMGQPLLFSSVPLITGLVVFGKMYVEKWRMREYFTKSGFDPERVRRRFDDPLETDDESGLPDPAQNLVVYRNFTPFVGAGVPLGSWTILVDGTRRCDDPTRGAPVPFTTPDVYEVVMSAIKRLHLPSVEVRDFIFAAGQDIRNDREILPHQYGRPAQRISPARMETLRLDNSDAQTRWYPWIRIYDWNNELVLSQFLRFHRQGKHLFIELNRYVLTPLGERERQIDTQPPKGIVQAIVYFVLCAIWGWMAAAVGILSLIGRAIHALDEAIGWTESQRRRIIRETPRFNFGTEKSLRESASSGSYEHYFQKIDASMYASILEKEIFNTVIEFLDAHNVDTSELKEQSTTILNSGIIVQGGNVNAEAIAVGERATARTMRNLAHKTGDLARKTFSGQRSIPKTGGQTA